MSESESPAPLGYDFFADVEGTRSAAHTVESGIRFQTPLNALARLEQSLQELPARLQLLHERGIALRSTLGEEVAKQTHRLRQAASQAREVATRQQAALEPRVVALWASIEANDEQIAADGYEAHAEAIAAALRESEALKVRMEAVEQEIHACFNEVANEVRALVQQVSHLERMVQHLVEATFRLGPGEVLVEAAEGTMHLKKETMEGVLFLTDQRLLFEQREEVTSGLSFLRRTRQVRELRFAEPLARVEEAVIGQRQGSDSLTLALSKEAATRTAAFTLLARLQPWARLIQELRAPSPTAEG